MKRHLISILAVCACTTISLGTIAFGSTDTMLRESFPLWESRYGSVLDEYRYAIENQLYPDSLPDNVSYALDTSSLDNVGYTFVDLDENGILELITGNMDQDDQFVYDVYTLDGDEPIQLKTSKLRSRVHISENNQVLYDYLQEGVYHYQIYDLDETNLSLVEELVSESYDTYKLISDDGEASVTVGDHLWNEFSANYTSKKFEFMPFSSSYAEEMKKMTEENENNGGDQSDEPRYDFSYVAVTPENDYEKGNRYANVEELEIDNHPVYRLTFNTSVTNARERPMGVSRTSFINDDYVYFVMDQGDKNYGIYRYDLNALEEEKLTEDDNIDDLMSVNGKYVFYLKDLDIGGGTLVRYSLATGKKKKIADFVSSMEYGDKHYLTYGESGDGSNVPIYITNRKGTDMEQIAKGLMAKIEDGKVVYMCSTNGSNFEVRSCEYDGSNDKAISKEFPYTDFLPVVQEYGF